MALTLETAADICHPRRERGPQDETLELAEKLIGEVNRRNADLEEEANVSPVFRAAARQLEGVSYNLVAYGRGMVPKQVLPTYIKQAREALDAMEAAIA